MSDIVIPNAKPPTNCFTCDYEKLTENCPCYIGICSASEYKDSRHPYCPLKEVPAEGNKWHIGTPTEGGLYFVYDKYSGYGKRELKEDISDEKLKDSFHNVIAWQKIEPYRG